MYVWTTYNVPFFKPYFYLSLHPLHLPTSPHRGLKSKAVVEFCQGLASLLGKPNAKKLRPITRVWWLIYCLKSHGSSREDTSQISPAPSAILYPEQKALWTLHVTKCYMFEYSPIIIQFPFEFQRELWVPSRSRDEVYGHGCSGRPRCANSSCQVHTSPICSRVLFLNFRISQIFSIFHFKTIPLKRTIHSNLFIFGCNSVNFFPNEWKTVKWQESSIAIVKSECKRQNAQINYTI